MFSAVSKRLKFANVATAVALVFAMTGGAFAAGKLKFVITSTKQIKPSVLSQLRGKAGPAGKEGPAGAPGKEGAVGKEGPLGKEGPSGKEGALGLLGPKGERGEGYPKVLQSGETEIGSWSLTSAGGAVSDISFHIPIAGPLAGTKVHLVEKKVQEGKIGAGVEELCEGKTGSELTSCEAPYKAIEAACPGNSESPSAVEGNLCIYVTVNTFATQIEIGPAGKGPVDLGGEEGAGVEGVALLQLEAGVAVGTWAVTAE